MELSSRMQKIVARMNPWPADTKEYWTHELAYWREVQKDGKLNQDAEVTERANKAIRICAGALARSLNGRSKAV